MESESGKEEPEVTTPSKTRELIPGLERFFSFDNGGFVSYEFHYVVEENLYVAHKEKSSIEKGSNALILNGG